jgi:cobalt-zinc-cadmium efflux system protein
MEHEHHHHHHHHGEAAQDVASLRGIYLISIALNLTFVLVEAGVGLWKGSLGLLSDAGHNLGDVFSLVLALVAFRLAASHSTKRFTYGYKKGSILISLLNAVILLVAVGAIIVESIHKLRNPVAIDGGAVAWTAGVGIVINGLTAFLLMRHQKNDINTRGAFLHMAADTLVSVGVVISGIVIALTGWTFIDPIIGLVIAVVILVSTWQLLAESIRMSMDAVPEGIHSDDIRQLIETTPGVRSVHHLHIWPISTTETALTAHLVIDPTADAEAVVHSAKHALRKAGIHHATLETEQEGHPCADETSCN